MKFSKMKTLVAMLMVVLMSGLIYGQDCANGRCSRVRGVMSAPVEGASYVLRTGAAVTRTAVNSTVAVGERIVDATGNILEATVDGVGNIVYRTASVATAPIRVVSSGLAQSKAERQAACGRMHHIGGGYGGGNYEGVGFSTISADHAISKCCYWGKRQAMDIGVARGRNGWYATVIYW